MYSDDQEDTTVYKVVVNHEEQYSIWPDDREEPLGWKAVGKVGLKEECLAYIEEVWTDMRPLSLRKQMEEAGRNPTPPGDAPEPSATDARDDLVSRLSTGEHPVEVDLRTEKTAQKFKENIDRGYVYIKFTNTQGGTEFGVRLDQDQSDLMKADFERQTGKVHLVGGLTLNYVQVRCVADIDLTTFTGQGHLEPVEG